MIMALTNKCQKKFQLLHGKSKKIFDIGNISGNRRCCNWWNYNFFNDIGIIFTIENFSTFHREK